MEYTKDGKMFKAPEKADIIEAATKHYKAKGYLKVKNRWSKEENGIEKIFFIQKSQWDKNDYYIRPGINIRELIKKSRLIYGDIFYDLDCYNKSVNEIFDEADCFLEKYGNLDALMLLIKTNYENRHEYFIDKYTETYLWSKIWKNHSNENKLIELLYNSKINKIKNDRLKLIAKKEELDPIILHRIQEFRNGIAVDLFKIYFEQKYQGTNIQGLCLLNNARVCSVFYENKGLFKKSNNSSWYDFCGLIDDENYIMEISSINFDLKQKNIELKGKLIKNKDIKNYELIFATYDNEIDCFWS